MGPSAVAEVKALEVFVQEHRRSIIANITRAHFSRLRATLTGQAAHATTCMRFRPRITAVALMNRPAWSFVVPLTSPLYGQS